jgi:hypothetical protein
MEYNHLFTIVRVKAVFNATAVTHMATHYGMFKPVYIGLDNIRNDDFECYHYFVINWFAPVDNPIPIGAFDSLNAAYAFWKFRDQLRGWTLPVQLWLFKTWICHKIGTGYSSLEPNLDGSEKTDKLVSKLA